MGRNSFDQLFSNSWSPLMTQLPQNNGGHASAMYPTQATSVQGQRNMHDQRGFAGQNQGFNFGTPMRQTQAFTIGTSSGQLQAQAQMVNFQGATSGQVQPVQSLASSGQAQAQNQPMEYNQGFPGQDQIHAVQYHRGPRGQGQHSTINHLQGPQRQTQAFNPHLDAMTQKRSFVSPPSAAVQSNKRQAVADIGGSPVQYAVQPPQTPIVDVRAQYTRQEQEAHRMKQLQDIATRKAMARRVAHAQHIADEKAREKKAQEAAAANTMRIEAERAAMKEVQAEKRRANLQAKKDAQDAADFAEAVRKCQEEQLEKERKAIRKQRLRKDPTALYRYYHEYITFFPPDKSAGEERNSYLIKLLANRTMSFDTESDLAHAIKYAHDNWDLYLEYPAMIDYAAKMQKEKMAKIAADGS